MILGIIGFIGANTLTDSDDIDPLIQEGVIHYILALRNNTPNTFDINQLSLVGADGSDEYVASAGHEIIPPGTCVPLQDQPIEILESWSCSMEKKQPALLHGPSARVTVKLRLHHAIFYVCLFTVQWLKLLAELFQAYETDSSLLVHNSRYGL